MDVYLVPLGGDRYELYCEVPDDEPEPAEEPSKSNGFFQRMKQRFTTMLAEAEHQRRHGHSELEHLGWLGRVKARSMRWVAESIAEQRLLWHLRRQEQACLFYPDDLAEAPAVAILRKQLGRDFDKHRFWLSIDSVGFVLSGLLMLVPGPNVLAYYFAFRMVGHYFSLRGARRGLSGCTWTNEPSKPLTDLRRAVALDGEERDRRVLDVALALNLEHLVKFFERMTVRTA